MRSTPYLAQAKNLGMIPNSSHSFIPRWIHQQILLALSSTQNLITFSPLSLVTSPLTFFSWLSGDNNCLTSLPASLTLHIPYSLFHTCWNFFLPWLWETSESSLGPKEYTFSGIATHIQLKTSMCCAPLLLSTSGLYFPMLVLYLPRTKSRFWKISAT